MASSNRPCRSASSTLPLGAYSRHSALATPRAGSSVALRTTRRCMLRGSGVAWMITGGGTGSNLAKSTAGLPRAAGTT